MVAHSPLSVCQPLALSASPRPRVVSVRPSSADCATAETTLECRERGEARRSDASPNDRTPTLAWTDDCLRWSDRLSVSWSFPSCAPFVPSSSRPDVVVGWRLLYAAGPDGGAARASHELHRDELQGHQGRPGEAPLRRLLLPTGDHVPARLHQAADRPVRVETMEPRRTLRRRVGQDLSQPQRRVQPAEWNIVRPAHARCSRWLALGCSWVLAVGCC